MRPKLAVLLLLGGCASDVALDGAVSLDTGAEASAGMSLPAEPPCVWAYGDTWSTPPESLREHILSLVGGPRVARLGWLEGGDARLDLELREPFDVRLGRDASDGRHCPDHALVDLILELSTDDGLLDELLVVTARIEAERARVEHWVPLDQLDGGLSPVGVGSYALVDVGLAMELDARRSSGGLTLHILRDVDGRQEVRVTPIAEWLSASF